MPFQTQFALSVELTRLVPLAGVTAAAAGAALLKLARDLRASGSDIVIEEDLATVFRQNRIDTKFERQFCKAITGNTRITSISDVFPIAMQSGPGATVIRALKDSAYLPFVIQVSLLCAGHEVESLCDGMEEALRLRAVGSQETSTPSSEAMVGVFRAVADQTAGFDWSSLFERVNNALGAPACSAGSFVSKGIYGPHFVALTVPVLQACLDMLAAVQRLYKDCVMKIDGYDGTTTVIVWAHHVLGLTVHVINSPKGTVIFGSGAPNVLIEIPEAPNSEYASVATLLDASGEILLQVDPAAGSTLTSIDAQAKFPVRGYAGKVFHLDATLMSPAAITDMCHYSAGLARYLLPRLVMFDEKRDVLNPIAQPVRLADRNVEAAIQLLLGTEHYNERAILSYQQAISTLASSDITPPPSVKLDLTTGKGKLDWDSLRRKSKSLAYLILALSAVGDLTECEDMLLADFGFMKEVPFLADGDENTKGDKTFIEYSYFFQAIASLLEGRLQMTGFESYLYGSSGENLPSMTSGWGWTVFYDSLFDGDPQSTEPWKIWIQRGVPHSNGRTAHRVVDGLLTTMTHLPAAEKADGAGEILHPRCANKVSGSQLLVSHRKDTFRVSRRYVLDQGHHFVTVGFAAIARMRWGAVMVDACLDGCNKAKTSQPPLKLAVGVATIRGFSFPTVPQKDMSYLPEDFAKRMARLHDEAGPQERIAIALTENNRHAQWLALAGVSGPNINRRAVLRRPGVCTACFIVQASQVQENILLVL